MIRGLCVLLAMATLAIASVSTGVALTVRAAHELDAALTRAVTGKDTP